MKNISHSKRLFLVLFLSIFLQCKYLPAGANSTVDRIAWMKHRSNSCLMSDNFTRVEANNECLSIHTYTTEKAPNHVKNLLIFLHGDSPFGGPTDYMRYLATEVTNKDTVSIVLIRPGYYDSQNNYSTGTSFRLEGDGYRLSIIETVADAIKTLKHYYSPEKLILVGHSGGAALSALIIDMYPKLANSTVLASCPCDVRSWANYHQMLWPKSYSPIEHTVDIDKKTNIVLISGNDDTNVLPRFVEAYSDKLKADGKVVTFITVPNEDHDSVIYSDSMKNAIISQL